MASTSKLTSMTGLLKAAQAGAYAVPAFNIHNMETLTVVVETANELKSPVILAATPSTVKYMGEHMLLAMASVAADGVSVPVALHLDHANDPETVIALMAQGYPSAMIDGSHLPFEENVAITASVVAAAKASYDPMSTFQISVEAELGRLGGIEDALEVSLADTFLTDPLAAKDFVQRTGIDCLAVAIGTAHGLYTKAPHIDLDRLSAIRNSVEVPLVLHGASGLSAEVVKACIARGIAKVNIATELKIAFKKGLVEHLIDNPGEEDPRRYFTDARAHMAEVIKQKIKMCGSDGRA